MKFEPVSERDWSEIINLFHSDLGVQEVIKKYNRSHKTIKKIWQTTYTSNQFKERTSRLCRLHKIGTRNPMFGKIGLEHHSAIEKEETKSGYIIVFAPIWYQGKLDGNKTYEHIISYCEHNGISQLPEGQVVHHLDENKQNNKPDNLILLSIADHRRLHSWLKKVQRLSQEGVENSVLEAPDNLIKVDDIVFSIYKYIKHVWTPYIHNIKHKHSLH